MGFTPTDQYNETNNGDERPSRPNCTSAPSHYRLLSFPSSRRGPIVALGRSDSCPLLDFSLFAQQLFNFELELDRAASVPFLDRLFLFDVPVDERVLDFRYPRSLFHSEISVSLHCRSPQKNLCQSSISSESAGVKGQFLSS